MNGPRVVITINSAGKIGMWSNVSFPVRKSMLSAMLNDLIQTESAEQIKNAKKIIKPTGFKIGEN